MNTLRKRLVPALAGLMGLATVASAGVALASNGNGSGPSTQKTPVAVSTDDRRGDDRRGEREPGDDRGRHNEPGDDRSRHDGHQGENEPGGDRGHHEFQGEEHHGDNRGPGGDDGEHGDNSGPGGND